MKLQLTLNDVKDHGLFDLHIPRFEDVSFIPLPIVTNNGGVNSRVPIQLLLKNVRTIHEGRLYQFDKATLCSSASEIHKSYPRLAKTANKIAVIFTMKEDTPGSFNGNVLSAESSTGLQFHARRDEVGYRFMMEDSVVGTWPCQLSLVDGNLHDTLYSSLCHCFELTGNWWLTLDFSKVFESVDFASAEDLVSTALAALSGVFPCYGEVQPNLCNNCTHRIAKAMGRRCPLPYTDQNCNKYNMIGSTPNLPPHIGWEARALEILTSLEFGLEEAQLLIHDNRVTLDELTKILETARTFIREG